MLQLIDFFARKNATLREEAKLKKMEAIDKVLLDDLIKLLAPLKKETESVQTKNKATGSLPLVSFQSLVRAYAPRDEDGEDIRVMRARLLRELHRHRVVKITATHSIATFLDPHYRNLKNLVPPDEKSQVSICGFITN